MAPCCRTTNTLLFWNRLIPAWHDRCNFLSDCVQEIRRLRPNTEKIQAYPIQDDRHLAAFLHYYEETPNQNVLKYMRRYFMMEHFNDMKQAYVMGLLKALKHYDITQLYDRLWEAFDNLEYEERKMLSQRYGFCLDCHSVYFLDTGDLDENGEPKKKLIPLMMYTDIATDHEYSSANTVQRKCRKALDKLRREIENLM
jgi:hypothetical protein